MKQPGPPTEKKVPGRKPRGARTVDGRTALLDAACSQIARKGLRGLRVEEVAQDAGVAVSLIYHHFGDRASLLRAALTHVGERADTYTEPRPGQSGRSALFESALAEFQDDPAVRETCSAWNEFRDAAVFDEQLRPVLYECWDRWINQLADLVRRGQADGTIATDVDPDGVGRRISAVVEGLVGRWLNDYTTLDSARADIQAQVEVELGPAPVA